MVDTSRIQGTDSQVASNDEVLAVEASRSFAQIYLPAVLVIGLICILFLLAMSSIADFQSAILEQTEQRLSTIARTQAIHLEDILNDTMGELAILAGNPTVKRRIINEVSGSGEADNSGYYPINDVYARLRKRASSFYRIDSEGVVQERVPFKPGREGESFAQKLGVKHVLEYHKPFVSEVFMTMSGKPCISLCHPDFDEEMFIGVIRGISYLEAINEVVEDISIFI